MLQELIITQTRWKRRAWIIGGVIGAVVLALLIAAIVILTSSKDSETTNQGAISLEDFLKGRLSSRSFNATWASG